MNKRERDKRSDQGLMDDLAAERVIRHLKRRTSGDSASAPHPRRGCMVCFGNTLEKSLARNRALPKRRSDRSLIGDLGDLHARVSRLDRKLNNLVARPGTKGASEPFEIRLLSLASDIDALARIVRDLRGPLTRLVKARCGNVGLAAQQLIGASSLLRGRE